jgi:hypothetical protein
LIIEESVENIDRRMEYMSLKNRRAETQIDGERAKIQKEEDKYKGGIEELKMKLEECLKDERIAMVLQKTYVD